MNKKLITTSLTGLLYLISSSGISATNIDGLYGSWCLTGMSLKIDGERIPDKATYTFTRDSMLKYDAGFFKQEDKFTVSGDKISTDSMGSYKIISIKTNKMILNYGGFMFFNKGACK
jgi:hypothetical protein